MSNRGVFVRGFFARLESAKRDAQWLP